MDWWACNSSVRLQTSCLFGLTLLLLYEFFVHFRALQTPTPADRRTRTCPWRRTLRLWGRRPTGRLSPHSRKQRSEIKPFTSISYAVCSSLLSNCHMIKCLDTVKSLQLYQAPLKCDLVSCSVHTNTFSPILAPDQTSGICCAYKCWLQPRPQWWCSCAGHGHLLWSQRLLAH